MKSEGFNWSSNAGGSGQQVVTLSSDKTSSSLYWQVHEAFNRKACITGEPIRCGDIIRLLHVGTKKRLHSHHMRSALSSQQEVSAFGETGEHGFEGGDDSDDWKVVCKDEYWTHGDNVRFWHVITGVYLR